MKKEKKEEMKRIKVVLLSLLTIIGLTFAGYKIVEHRTIEKIVQSDVVKTIIEQFKAKT